MQIKQFVGASLEELLPQIRAELGDDAVILQTKRVVRGGIGGFFGREGIEVTAAEGVPEDENHGPRDARDAVRSIDLVDDDEVPASVNERAALSAQAQPAADDRRGAFARSMSTSLAAAREAEDVRAPEPAPAAPEVSFAPGGATRTQALIESAREAMRQASARGQAAEAEAQQAAAAPPARRSKRGRVISALRASDGRSEAKAPGAEAPIPSPAPWQPPRISREDAEALGTAEALVPAPADSEAAELARAAAAAIDADLAGPVLEPRIDDVEIEEAVSDLIASAKATTAAEPRAADADQPTGPIPVAGHAPTVEPAPATPPIPEDHVVMPAADAPPAPAPARPASSGGVAGAMAALAPRGARRAPAGRESPAGGLAPDDPLAAVHAELIGAGVESRYADSILEGFRRGALPYLDPGADLRGAVAGWIAGRLPLAREPEAHGPGRAIALVGQSGVGKTTTACKLAAAAARAGQRTALVLAGPGPHHAAVGLAGELGLEVVVATDADELEAVRDELSDRDLVVIDTAGRSHKRPEELDELADLLAGARADEVHLVVPAAAALADMGGLARGFRGVGVTRLTVTKLDETSDTGNLVNYPMRTGLAIGFLADGPAVPGDLRPADGLEIAGMIIS